MTVSLLRRVARPIPYVLSQKSFSGMSELAPHLPFISEWKRIVEILNSIG